MSSIYVDEGSKNLYSSYQGGVRASYHWISNTLKLIIANQYHSRVTERCNQGYENQLIEK